MRFGLRNVGQTFQRFMDEVLEGLEYCFVYVDDVLIGSKSQEEHMQHLREVLSRLEEHGIVLNGEKCMLGVPEVQLGDTWCQHVASFLFQRRWPPYMPSRGQGQLGS